MDPREIVNGLSGFRERAPGSDAERRAARWLAGRLRGAGRDVDMETHWVRPHWAAVHALHCALAVAGSVVSVDEPRIGVAILGVALVSAAVDLSGRGQLLRRITPQRATQNVVAPAPPESGTFREHPRLIVTAHYDAGRGGFVYRPDVRRAAARLSRLARGRWPGPFASMLATMTVLTAIAIARVAGVSGGGSLRVVQLIATVGLVLALAALVDVALSGTAPGAGDNASGVAVALALVDALHRAPPRSLAVELVLAGAGEAQSLGMGGYVRGRRRTLAREATVFLELAACGGGRPRWWTGDGVLPPLRFHPRLLGLCERVARDEALLGAAPHRGHSLSGAYRARARGFPAVVVGCLDEHGLAPRSHQHSDTPERVDAGAMNAALEFCLALVDRLDADLARLAGR